MTPAIVLAAGTSSRYGYANKLLTPYQGKPLLAHTIAALTPVACPIVVVTGYQSARVIKALRRALSTLVGVHFVVNRDFSAGMASSLQAGLRALPACFRRVLLCLGDMPSIDPQLVRRLQQQARPGIDYLRPVHGSQPGHPVLITHRLFAPIAALGGDRGAQAVLAMVAPARRRLLSWHAGCLRDTDTAQALRRVAAFARR